MAALQRSPASCHRRDIITSDATSAALGQPAKPSILRNLENQPTLQKQRGDIGSKDGYGI